MTQKGSTWGDVCIGTHRVLASQWRPICLRQVGHRLLKILQQVLFMFFCALPPVFLGSYQRQKDLSEKGIKDVDRVSF